MQSTVRERRAVIRPSEIAPEDRPGQKNLESQESSLRDFPDGEPTLSPNGVAALEYLRLGYSPIPIIKGTAHPVVEWKPFQDRPPSTEEVEGWWRHRPDAGIALLTGTASGHVVIDQDPRNGGECSWVELEERYGPLPADAPRVRTPRSGWHRYLGDHGLHLPTITGMVKGIDVLAQVGFVLAPPTKRPNRGRYTFERDARLLPVAALPPPPEWLVDLIREKHESRLNRTRSTLTPVRKRPTGERTSAAPEKNCSERSEQDQAEFAALWAMQGIVLRPGDHAYACPNHTDTRPSLMIDSVRCIWNCFSCGSHGGLDKLRSRLGWDGHRGEEQARPNLSNTNTHTPSPKKDSDMSWCPRSVPLYQQRQGEDQGVRTSAPCRMLTCPFCGPRERQRDAVHYVQALLDTGRSVWRDTVADNEFEAWAKRVGRAKRLYVRCPLIGQCVVFTTYPGTEAIDEEDLYNAILEAMMSVPSHEGHRGLNVTSSRSLVPPWRRKRKEVSENDTLTFPIKSVSKFNERVVDEHRVLRTEGGKPVSEATRLWVEAEEMGSVEWLMWAQRSGVSPTTDRTMPRSPWVVPRMDASRRGARHEPLER